MRRHLGLALLVISACAEQPLAPTVVDAPADDEPIDPPATTIPGLIDLNQFEVVGTSFHGTEAFAVFGDQAIPKPLGSCHTLGPGDRLVGASAGTIHITGSATFELPPQAVTGGFAYSLENPSSPLLVPGETLTAMVDGDGGIEPHEIGATAPALPVATIPPIVDLTAGPVILSWTSGSTDQIEIEIDLTDGLTEVSTTCVVADSGSFDATEILDASPQYDHAIYRLSTVRETTTNTSRLRLRNSIADTFDITR